MLSSAFERDRDFDRKASKVISKHKKTKTKNESKLGIPSHHQSALLAKRETNSTSWLWRDLLTIAPDFSSSSSSTTTTHLNEDDKNDQGQTSSSTTTFNPNNNWFDRDDGSRKERFSSSSRWSERRTTPSIFDEPYRESVTSLFFTSKPRHRHATNTLSTELTILPLIKKKTTFKHKTSATKDISLRISTEPTIITIPTINPNTTTTTTPFFTSNYPSTATTTRPFSSPTNVNSNNSSQRTILPNSYLFSTNKRKKILTNRFQPKSIKTGSTSQQSSSLTKDLLMTTSQNWPSSATLLTSSQSVPTEWQTTTYFPNTLNPSTSFSLFATLGTLASSAITQAPHFTLTTWSTTTNKTSSSLSSLVSNVNNHPQTRNLSSSSSLFPATNCTNPSALPFSQLSPLNFTSNLILNHSLSTLPNQLDEIDLRLLQNPIIIQSSELLNGTLANGTSTPPFPNIAIHHPWLGILLAFICLLVISGNMLIILAVRKSRPLRQQVTNQFVASLAMADCLVGLLVMPFSALHEVMDKVWIFGPDWCDLWHSCDVLASTSSILSLCVISVDRYWAITDPISYPRRMSNRKAKALIALVWICSCLISFPAIFWWRAVSPQNQPYECNFPVSTGYIVFSSTLSFYGPLVVMVFVYYKIYRAAVEQTRSMRAGGKTITCERGSSSSNAAAGAGGTAANGSSQPHHQITLRMHRGGNTISGAHGLPAMESAERSKFFGRPSKSESSGELSSALSLKRKVPILSKQPTVDQFGVDRTTAAWNFSRKVSKLAKERKAAKTLGIVMGVFILCWLPFFTTHILMGICGQKCDINEDLVYSIVTWLGWLNSAMNPWIYAVWSRDFRRAFRKVLCGFRSGSGGGSGHFSSQFYGRFSKHNQKARQRQVTAFAINSEMNRTNTENRRRRLMELSRLQQSRTSATSLSDVSNDLIVGRDSNNNSSGGGMVGLDEKAGLQDDDVIKTDSERNVGRQDGHLAVGGRELRGRFSKVSELSSVGERRQLDRLAAWEALKTGLQPIPELSSSCDPNSPMISPCVEEKTRKAEKEEDEPVRQSDCEQQVSSEKENIEQEKETNENNDEIKVDHQLESDRISIESDDSAHHSGDEFTIRIQLIDGQVSIKSIK